jgi:hypothetical protein
MPSALCPEVFACHEQVLDSDSPPITWLHSDWGMRQGLLGQTRAQIQVDFKDNSETLVQYYTSLILNECASSPMQA